MPYRAKTNSFYEDFDEGALNAAAWANFISSGTIVVAGTSLTLTPANSTTGEAQITSINQFDLQDSFLAAKVTTTSPSGAVDNVLKVYIDASNAYSILVEGTLFVVDRLVAGAETGPFTATYDPVAMAWWRIRESKGTIYFEVSPDSHSWTTLYKEATAIDVRNMTILITCVEFASTATPGAMVVDKVNTPPLSARNKNVRLRPFAP